MKPIINPWIVYLAEKCDTIHLVFAILMILCFVTVAMWTIAYVERDAEIKPQKWLIALTILSASITILMPEKDTVLTMATLSYVTEDNIKSVGKTAEDVVDYVVDAVDKIVNDKE